MMLYLSFLAPVEKLFLSPVSMDKAQSSTCEGDSLPAPPHLTSVHCIKGEEAEGHWGTVCAVGASFPGVLVSLINFPMLAFIAFQC